jgi:hypothetical protein
MKQSDKPPFFEKRDEVFYSGVDDKRDSGDLVKSKLVSQMGENKY